MAALADEETGVYRIHIASNNNELTECMPFASTGLSLQQTAISSRSHLHTPLQDKSLEHLNRHEMNYVKYGQWYRKSNAFMVLGVLMEVYFYPLPVMMS